MILVRLDTISCCCFVKPAQSVDGNINIMVESATGGTGSYVKQNRKQSAPTRIINGMCDEGSEHKTVNIHPSRKHSRNNTEGGLPKQLV